MMRSTWRRRGSRAFTRSMAFLVLSSIGLSIAFASTRTSTPVTTFEARDDWKRITAPLALTFPRDHGSHEDCRTEWWYATGIANATSGDARFGWQLTIFRIGLDATPRTPDEPMLSPKHVFAAHFAVVDLATGRSVHAERMRRAVPGLAHASSLDMDVALDGWTIRRDVVDGVESIRASATDRDAGVSLALTLTPTKPFVVHGRDGISVKGDEPGNASAYVSWTRLATSGTLTIGGATHAIQGEAWFDHEWGSTQLGDAVAGWDWFGLRFDDGRELMLYQLRRGDGVKTISSSATWIERDGSRRHVASDEFTLLPVTTWTSPRTRAVYPASWRLAIPSLDVDVTITAQTPDCELDGRRSTGTVYWEGPVRVEGSARGEGYGELTGYFESMAGRF